MAIAAIDGWLKSKRDYSAGVGIVVQYSKNDFLKATLKKRDTAFNRELLLKEMVRLNQAEEKKEPVVIRREIITKEAYVKGPKELQQLADRAKELFKINGRRHAELATFIAEAEKTYAAQRGTEATYLNSINNYLKERNAGDKVHAILDADFELAELYYRIDFYERFKKFPEDVSREHSFLNDPMKLARELGNVRSRISKLKKADNGVALAMAMQERDVLERRLDELV